MSGEDVCDNHHQPINAPTAGAQAFLMDYAKGDSCDNKEK
jgi:hypothetical protein